MAMSCGRISRWHVSKSMYCSQLPSTSVIWTPSAWENVALSRSGISARAPATVFDSSTYTKVDAASVSWMPFLQSAGTSGAASGTNCGYT